MPSLSLLSLLVLSSSPTWRPQGSVEGIAVELREVAGSKFEEIRLTTTSALPLGALCDAIWAKGLGSKADGDFKKRVVIKETDDERWTYEQIHVPIVSDRDYVMYVKLVQPAATGHCEVLFETRSDPKYPPVADHVRIPSVRGSWEVEPIDGGKVQIRYRVYSDPGGSVPALFARGGQREAAVNFLKVILHRAHPT